MDPLARQLTNPRLGRLLEALELFRVLDREVPAQVISTFLYVASHNPCHKQALEQDLGFTTASASRNTAWLSDQHRLKKPGLGLIHKYKDPSNNRRVLLALTEKGEELSERLLGSRD